MPIDPDELASLQERLAAEFPCLRAEDRGGVLFVVGSFFLRESNVELARYDVEIEFPQDQRKLPIVREVGGRIPWTRDRHVESDGKACLFVPDERWKHYPIGSDSIDYIRGPLRNFFLWQAYYEIEGKPLFEGRSHGPDGILESYYEELQTGE
jgi:hypothetical protein